MARLHRYRIGIPPELSEIRTQPWLSEVSLTCDPYHHRGPIFNCHNSCACVTPVPTVFNPPAIHQALYLSILNYHYSPTLVNSQIMCTHHQHI